ncbi:tannase/feruloyl esterase family alpha/beta hydrolase [Actinosynnema sp. NPDC091369]
MALVAPASAEPAHQVGETTCAPVTVPAPAGARIESVRAEHRTGGTITFPPTPFSQPAPITDVPPYCEVTVTLTHDGNDHVAVAVALPGTGWTGRLQAVGGSAYTAGDFGAPLVQAVKDGYVGVTTDAGVPLTFLDTGWALTADGRIDRTPVTNFATRSVHESAVVGKDVVRAFYGRPVTRSYWNGCSTGGRQGYAEAQDHPRDFDGILADAPAIDWARFAVATLWPQTVMHNDRHFPTDCVLGAFRQAAVEVCDARDGVTDGVVDRPDECDYDPSALVGATVLCEGRQVTVTAQDADVARKIWAGPTDAGGARLWPGLPKGADFTGLAATRVDEHGVPFAPGFPVATAWVRTFLAKQPAFDTSTITYERFTELFQQSVREYDRVIGTSDADLGGFRRAGGKLVTVVGTADQLIPPGGTLAYRDRVDRLLGCPDRVNDFYRLFLAPGAAHCGGGAGPSPTNPLGALVDWVEHGKAPATLPAVTADGRTRDLCAYPRVSRYRGYGDPAVASSYRCARD